jgi:hypothetical protein
MKFCLFRYIGDARVRVSLARPRTRGGGRRNFDPNMYVDMNFFLYLK